MDFVAVDGRGMHFKRHRSLQRGPYHLESIGKEIDVVLRRTALRKCRVIRSNAAFPKLQRETPISVEVELDPDALQKVRKILKCLLLEDSNANNLLRTSEDGAFCLLVSAPSFFYNRWSRQSSRLGVWGSRCIEIGSVVDMLVDGVVRRGIASFRLVEILKT